MFIGLAVVHYANARTKSPVGGPPQCGGVFVAPSIGIADADGRTYYNTTSRFLLCVLSERRVAAHIIYGFIYIAVQFAMIYERLPDSITVNWASSRACRIEMALSLMASSRRAIIVSVVMA